MHSIRVLHFSFRFFCRLNSQLVAPRDQQAKEGMSEIKHHEVDTSTNVCLFCACPDVVILNGAGCSDEVNDGISIIVHFYKYWMNGKINHRAASSNQNGTDRRKDLFS